MSDKPQPGKDKDLRNIRQAMEATQQLFGLLAAQGASADLERHAAVLAEALLLTADQLDCLAQMLSDPEGGPAIVIELNRELRRLVRLLLQQNRADGGVALMHLAQAAGNQLNALLVVQEIRSPESCNRPLSSLPSSQHRRQRNNVLDK
jgi:hypothetical protein